MWEEVFDAIMSSRSKPSSREYDEALVEQEQIRQYFVQALPEKDYQQFERFMQLRDLSGLLEMRMAFEKGCRLMAELFAKEKEEK